MKYVTDKQLLNRMYEYSSKVNELMDKIKKYL